MCLRTRPTISVDVALASLIVPTIGSTTARHIRSIFRALTGTGASALVAGVASLMLVVTPVDRPPYRIARETPSEANAWTSIGPEGATVTALAVDPTNQSVVYGGTQNAGVFKSVDGGASWRLLVPASGIGLFVTAFKIDPNSPATVYAATHSNGVAISWKLQWWRIPHRIRTTSVTT